MKKTTIILSIVAVILGTSVPKIATGQNKNLSKSQLISKIEKIEEKNQKLEQQLKEKTEELKAIKEKTQSLKYSPEIDELLNIEDTTIFRSRFKPFDIKDVHPRSREMYQWVQEIHELGQLMAEIETANATIERFNSDLANLPPATIQQLQTLNSGIKDNIRSADEKRTTIEQSYKEMKKVFSLSQMDYYNSLVQKLNNFINLYFNE